MVYWTDLEQEPYDPEEFVERLAWRTSGAGGAAKARETATQEGGGGDDRGDEHDSTALQLHDAFVEAIKQLTQMHDAQKKKCDALEVKVRDEEQQHWRRVAKLLDRNRQAATIYKSLDERINSVATKVVHLGDQLESVNTPRARDSEALRLMKHFDEFLGGETNLSPVFNDKSRLHEAADIIQKLQLIAQELPPRRKCFQDAIAGIEKKYAEIERALIEEFVKSHRSGDNARMKEIASILSHFRGYSQCVDAFIEQIQLQHSSAAASAGVQGLSLLKGGGGGREKDVFKEVPPLCEKSWSLIGRVFPNPHQVMGKFVLNVYHSKLKEHISHKLQHSKSNSEQYLNDLYTLYSQTTKLTSDLSHFNLGSDQLFLTNLTQTIFRGYLDSYINIESRFLNERCTHILQRYYVSKGHQKKASSATSSSMMNAGAEKLQDLKRDLHGFIASKANINMDTTVSYGGETFLSEEVSINLLQLTKTAFVRCRALSPAKDLPSNASEILNILVSYLVHEHLDYAIEIGLQGIPIAEGAKSVPELYFFDVVGQTNAIQHLLEKQFHDSVLPLVVSTPRHADCLNLKRNELEKLERKLDTGLDRTLSALAGWVRTILSQEQRKSDFNPPTSKMDITTTPSAACTRVVRFVTGQHDKIRECMDGNNIEAVLLQLGIRVHRVIYDHLLQFTYNSSGAMSAICDVQEYRRCMGEFKVSSVNALFDTLHAMCNLLILPAENLRGATCGDQLANLDKTILDNWIALRVDYKSERLGNFL